jgi:hypothetical protein
MTNRTAIRRISEMQVLYRNHCYLSALYQAVFPTTVARYALDLSYVPHPRTFIHNYTPDYAPVGMCVRFDEAESCVVLLLLVGELRPM